MADRSVERAYSDFPIVGIGASSGGLAAFKSFFGGFPLETNVRMAFVVVQHLAPDHKSSLVDLLANFTSMRVVEVTDGLRVQPNCVYVIPSNHGLSIHEGNLQLLELSEPRSQRLPIDFFFEALACDQGPMAIGIILSGSGCDGTHGVRAIHNAGGTVIVQKPESTEFDSMPRHAIQTGVADFISDVSMMPSQLLEFCSHMYPLGPRLREKPTIEIEHSIQKIFTWIRARTGHDFSNYKPSTIDRRIERRMAVHGLASVEEYERLLQQSPAEIDALFQDLLIGVTYFFRDPESFEKLEKISIPQLLREKSATGSPLRVWVCGCSTGEEAYSIAILIHEQLEALHATGETVPAVQIFASDIDSRAIAMARSGLYPKSIAECLSHSRLTQYFTFEPENAAFRIHKKIRELVVFSEHDVIKDPPFSKLDLISCRNLMIYFGGDLQQKLIPLFHFALNPKGVLFLGSSESIGHFELLFGVVDRKAKLYLRKTDLDVSPQVRWPRTTDLPSSAPNVIPSRVRYPSLNKPPLKALMEQAVLTFLSPMAVLVDSKGNILYLLGRTGTFLEPAAGEPGISNVFKMAREGLRHPLAAALHKVVESKQSATLTKVPVKSNGHFTIFDITVSPIQAGLSSDFAESYEGIYLILLVESIDPSPVEPIESNGSALVHPSMVPASAEPAKSSHIGIARTEDKEALIESLNSQLKAKEEYLQTAYEELELANEELTSSNEEMQSVNEELQSTNEELETSKEELQSINEELATVNTELQNKVGDLSRFNNDMNNLLSGSGIATIFVDTNLSILRFTPAMAQIINLIEHDVGRPVGHVVTNLVHYDRLVADAELVLETLAPLERQVQTTSGLWFQMRLKPYRTIDNVIEGVVITFVDVTAIKQMNDSLELSNRQHQLADYIRNASDAVTIHDLNGRILAWNPSATRMYGWSEEEALQLSLEDRVPKSNQLDGMSEIVRLCQRGIPEPYRSQRLTKDGRTIDVWISSTSLLNESGGVYAISTTERELVGVHEHERD